MLEHLEEEVEEVEEEEEEVEEEVDLEDPLLVITIKLPKKELLLPSKEPKKLYEETFEIIIKKFS